MASSMGKGLVVENIKPPIIVVEGHDLSVHASMEEVQRHLEAIDVKKNVYQIYDAEGRILTLGVAKVKRSIFFGLFKTDVEEVILQQTEASPSHKEALHTLLIDFLSKQGKSSIESLQKLTLEQLIQQVSISS